MTVLLSILLTAQGCEGVRVTSAGESSTALLRVLSSRGIPAGQACARVDVSLDQGPDGLTLRLEAGEKSGAYTVHDLDVATALVESWVRSDLAKSLLEGPSELVESAEPGAARLTTPVAAGTKVERSLASPESSSDELEVLEANPARVTAALEAHWADDGSGALGAFAEARLAFGWIEAGIRARGFAGLPMRDETLRTATVRRGSEILLGVSLPLVFGSVEVAPSLWSGFGILESLRSDAGRDGCTTACPPIVDDGFSAGSMGFRGEVGLGASYEVLEDVRLGLSMSASYAPGTSPEAIVPAYASVLSAEERSALALAPEAPLRIGLGVGVEVRP
ncbi:MAG: hypothetical protein HY791_17385 [Deltaproteobacteria bacterium]|nr:hypothetical protein [Deltaproteobacteria bacterium]